MKSVYYLILALIFNTSIFSQGNIVNNGSFENKEPDNIACTPIASVDNGLGLQCCANANYTPLGGPIPLVKDWTLMNNQTGSPDYFNKCFDSGTVGVPVNGFGNQSPYDGDAYAGFQARFGPATSPEFLLYTEYLQVPLFKTLIAGQTYKAIMHVSRADDSRYACAGLGMLFTQGPASGDGTYNIINTYIPQVQSNSLISDAINWTEISGTFTATGGEDYLTIGVFNQRISNPVQVDPSVHKEYAYYYVDGVALIDGGTTCCEQLKIYQNNSNLPGKTEVQDYIEAGRDISSLLAQGNVVVKTGQNVTFQAGNSIQLLPGFVTEVGSVFTPIIAPCHNYDLYPYSDITAIVPTGYQDCPGVKNYAILTSGATSFTFEAFVDKTSETIAKNSGLITDDGEPVIIWDGRFKGGDSWPDPVMVIDYTLSLSGSCDRTAFFKGNITVFQDCAEMRKISSNSSPKGLQKNYNQIPDLKDSLGLLNGQNNVSLRDTMNLIVFPNPNDGMFSLRVESAHFKSESMNLMIYDLYGNIISKSLIINSETKINLKEYAKGIYLIKVVSADGDTYIKRVIYQ